MQTIEVNTEILNDLIQINNDRISGYENALKELKEDDADLKGLFLSMIDESRRCKMALATEVGVNGGDVENGTTASGKIYNAWREVKSIFSGHDRKTILSNCEFGEDATQKAYRAALEEDELPAFLFNMIAEQKSRLKTAHDEIKALRDAVALR